MGSSFAAQGTRRLAFAVLAWSTGCASGERNDPAVVERAMSIAVSPLLDALSAEPDAFANVGPDAPTGGVLDPPVVTTKSIEQDGLDETVGYAKATTPPTAGELLGKRLAGAASVAHVKCVEVTSRAGFPEETFSAVSQARMELVKMVHGDTIPMETSFPGGMVGGQRRLITHAPYMESGLYYVIAFHRSSDGRLELKAAIETDSSGLVQYAGSMFTLDDIRAIATGDSDDE